MTSNESSFNPLDYTYKVFMIAALTIVAVILAQDIVVPLIISGILTVVLLPLVKRLERKISSTLAIISIPKPTPNFFLRSLTHD